MSSGTNDSTCERYACGACWARRDDDVAEPTARGACAMTVVATPAVLFADTAWWGASHGRRPHHGEIRPAGPGRWPVRRRPARRGTASVCVRRSSGPRRPGRRWAGSRTPTRSCPVGSSAGSPRPALRPRRPRAGVFQRPRPPDGACSGRPLRGRPAAERRVSNSPPPQEPCVLVSGRQPGVRAEFEDAVGESRGPDTGGRHVDSVDGQRPEEGPGNGRGEVAVSRRPLMTTRCRSPRR